MRFRPSLRRYPWCYYDVMCGRYSQFLDEETIAERFHVRLPDVPLKPNYNAAPGQEQLTIVNVQPDVLTLSTWGFLPAWAAGRPGIKPIINARAETVATKPFFKQAFQTRRCLVLADGFYEWKKSKGGKTPFRFILKTEEPFAFAGIWSTIHNAAGEDEQTFAIITSTPNKLVAEIHDRMPVILHPDDEEDWLNEQLSLEEAQALLAPYPASLMTAYQVSAKVNSPANNSPEVIERV
jgi:putative SOS response-associated peptidase YedK